MITYSSWLLRSALPGRPSAWQLTARHPPPTLTEAIYLLFTFALIFLFLFFNFVFLFQFLILLFLIFCFKLFSNHQIDCPWKIYCQCDTFKCYLDLVLALFVYMLLMSLVHRLHLLRLTFWNKWVIWSTTLLGPFRLQLTILLQFPACLHANTNSIYGY